jgi:hypothetical protein
LLNALIPNAEPRKEVLMTITEYVALETRDVLQEITDRQREDER